jgi:hypothetical protein
MGLPRVMSIATAAALAAGAVTGCGLSLGGGSRSGAPVGLSLSSPSNFHSPSNAQGGSRASARSRGGTSARAAPGAALARAQRTHELPTPAPAQTAPGGWRSPVQAVQVFSDVYINWTAATVATHLRLLAEASIGQARSAMALAAAQTGRDADLRRGGIANSGMVEAIAPVTGRRNVYAVVTRERTTATNDSAYRGLAPTWHVTLATVVRVQRGLWTLSGWQPES